MFTQHKLTHEGEVLLFLHISEGKNNEEESRFSLKEREVDMLNAECIFLHNTLGWGEGLAELEAQGALPQQRQDSAGLAKQAQSGTKPSHRQGDVKQLTK